MLSNQGLLVKSPSTLTPSPKSTMDLEFEILGLKSLGYKNNVIFPKAWATICNIAPTIEIGTNNAVANIT